jgi:hypothetical protein
MKTFPVSHSGVMRNDCTQDEVLFNYEMEFDQQLMYMGLSRVMSIYGLHLTNHNSVYMFHYWKGFSTSKIKDLHTELTSLERHKLLTITDRPYSFSSESV